jgi:serine/threonine-protein kinase
VKIIDLGQACATGTVKKRIQGTPGYMAPEQAHRQAITPRTDIYNPRRRDVLGAGGRGDSDDAAAEGRFQQSVHGALDAGMVEAPVAPHVKNPSIHPLLSKQILHCVQLDPDDRPVSMQAVLHRLDLISEMLEASPAMRRSRRPSASRTRKRSFEAHGPGAARVSGHVNHAPIPE